jgi:uncharacterized protein YkwD
MRGTPTACGPDRNDRSRPAQRGTSGYRRFGSHLGVPSVMAASAQRAGAVVTAAGELSRPAAAAPAAPSTFADMAEAELLALLDAERATLGLPALAFDGRLRAAAAAQAGSIAAAGSLFHQDLIPLLGNWRMVGENVGSGPSVASINPALVSSPDHHANMVNPDFTHVGIGVVTRSDGRVWVSQLFGG